MQKELGNHDSLNLMFQVRKMDRHARAEKIGISTDFFCGVIKVILYVLIIKKIYIRRNVRTQFKVMEWSVTLRNFQVALVAPLLSTVTSMSG